jgi:phosphinothricin acetyltransferase
LAGKEKFFRGDARVLAKAEKFSFPSPAHNSYMITIRQFKKEDATQVAVLIPQLTKNIVEPASLVKRLENLATAQNWQYFVAELEDKIVGFAGLVWYPVASKGLIGWIEEVVVDEAFRGQGIGRSLMEVLLKLAEEKNIKQVKLTSTNIALPLYEKFGFNKKDQDYLVKNLD